MIRIAIDTGGTFTDCVYVVDGRLSVLKVPSTPRNPAEAVLRAVERIANNGAAEIRHGTTVGTNALLERKGGRVAFVTTAGFEDTIAIGRQARPKLYDFEFTKPEPLAGEQLRFGVAERTAADGQILKRVDAAELQRLREVVRGAAPEAIAVSLLFAFANTTNEEVVVGALRELGVPVSASHEILPEFREYERGSTVLINAYLLPKMQGYLQELDTALARRGSRLHVMQSSGGIIPARMAAAEPVRTVLSGPAGGVVGAMTVARMVGIPCILSFDMGGTSTDVALTEVGRGLRTTTESEIAGMPVAVPMLHIHTVGAGGGSVASFDRGGALKVGPESAGAEPGPICYGRGTEPTVTDANLVLGRLDAEHFLSGGMRLDAGRARAYLEAAKGKIADVETFAEGILRLVDAHMLQGLRRISVEQGRDPREFELVSFGGAGPLHACALARGLRIPRVLVPNMPGALSAYGILVSDMVRDFSRTVMLDAKDAAIEEHFRALEETGRREMEREGLEAVSVRSVDVRYAGQGYELTVDWSAEFASEFHRMHEQRYGYADKTRRVEIVNARVRFIAATEPIEMEREALEGGGDAAGAVVKEKPIYSDGRWHAGKVYDRERLRPGDAFAGPAIVTEYSATTFLPPGARATVDGFRNLRIEVEA